MVVMVAGLLQWLSVSMARPYTEDVPAARSGNARLDAPTESVSRPDGEQVFNQVAPAYVGVSAGPQEPSYSDSDGFPQSIPPSPTPSVVEAATARVSSQGGQLTEAEAIAVLEAAGWPTELIPQALAVSYCESKWSPGAVGDSGRSMGLFQVNLATWFSYAGADPELWADPLTNARVAWLTYQYDLGRGYAPWTQWSCKP